MTVCYDACAGNTGLQGPQGERGVQGPQGIPGDQGPMGPAGTGQRGPVGPQGPQGPQGPIGVGQQGQRGASGKQGTTGVRGIGCRGHTGIQGSTGVWQVSGTGIGGMTGLLGLTGVQGETGVQGLVGTTGIQGLIGSTGIQGQTGLTGSTGIQGSEGSTGVQGIQGSEGSTGVQGIQGSVGSTGVQGIQGSVGSTGVQGIQGSVGSTGVQGIQGSTGVKGQTGLIGTTGLQGSVGSTGVQGLGVTGLQGVIGATGIGIAGATGFGVGTVGVTGIYPGSHTGIVYGGIGTPGITGLYGKIYGTTFKGTQIAKNDGISHDQRSEYPGAPPDFSILDSLSIAYLNKETVSLYQFNFSLPSNAVMLDATVYFKLKVDGGLPSDTISIRQLKKSWGIDDTNAGPYENPQATQGQATWNRSFDYDGSGGDQLWTTGDFDITQDCSAACFSRQNVNTEGAWYGFPCTSMVRNWVEKKEPNYGFALFLTGPNPDYKTFWGDSTSANAPYLTLMYDTNAIPLYVQQTPLTRWVDATTLTFDNSNFSDGSYLTSILPGTWNGNHLQLGPDHIWTDANGIIRFKPSYPISDLDGISIIGETGVQGGTGVQGFTGIYGQTGVQGVTGLIGSTGVQGVTGVTGRTGVQGGTGIQGLVGSTGVQGQTGLIGSTGVQGQTGLIGSTGVQGQTGLIGSTGVQGQTGLIGSTGIQGQIGSTGVQGQTGLIGSTGVQGSTGFLGSTGIQGITGPSSSGAIYYLHSHVSDATSAYQLLSRTLPDAGEAISTVTVKSATSPQTFGGWCTNKGDPGTLVPAGIRVYHLWIQQSSSSGNTNIAAQMFKRDSTGTEIFLADSTSGDLPSNTDWNEIIWSINILSPGLFGSQDSFIQKIWVLTTAGSDKNVSIAYEDQTHTSYIETPISIGPQGPTGQTGVQGSTGVQGETGIQGLVGSTGVQGLIGSTGVQGVTGILGTDGRTGIQGVTGVLGIDGQTGLIGSTGIQGLIGSTGIRGVTGVLGIDGQTGLVGATGLQGSVGNTGIQGITGITASLHTALLDMPDLTGVLTDHDTRLVAKVQTPTPTVPTPFKGMFWYNPSGVSPGQTLASTLVSTTYVVLSTDELIVASGTGYSVTLPAATGSGRLIWVKYIGTGTVAVKASGAETIDGINQQDLLADDCLMIADYQAGKWAIL